MGNTPNTPKASKTEAATYFDVIRKIKELEAQAQALKPKVISLVEAEGGKLFLPGGRVLTLGSRETVSYSLDAALAAGFTLAQLRKAGALTVSKPKVPGDIADRLKATATVAITHFVTTTSTTAGKAERREVEKAG